jgi:6-phosphogluconolactonase
MVLADEAAVAAATADRVVWAGRNAIRRRGVFRIALSGGTTPLLVYPLLLDAPRVRAVDWSLAEFFWADERAVPPTDRDSNYNAALGRFLSDLPGARLSAVHRMPAERPDLDAAAQDYQAEMARAFGIPADGPTLPVFDLIWLGMGRDGHTASLFPGSQALSERRRWVVGNWAPASASRRMTLTYPVLNAAREALFQVCGPGKDVAFAAVQAGTPWLPAASVHARRTLWIVDRAVAGGTERAA